MIYGYIGGKEKNEKPKLVVCIEFSFAFFLEVKQPPSFFNLLAIY